MSYKAMEYEIELIENVLKNLKTYKKTGKSLQSIDADIFELKKAIAGTVPASVLKDKGGFSALFVLDDVNKK